MKNFLLFFIVCLPLISVSQRMSITGNDKDLVIKPPEDIVVDCAQCLTPSFDKVTGDSILTSKEIIVLDNDKNSLLIMGSFLDSRLILSIFSDNECIDEGSKINVLFNDNSRLELINEHAYNCKGQATVYFGNPFGKQAESKEAKELRQSIPDFFAKQEKLPQLKELKTKKIQTIRVWAYDSFIQADFTEKNSTDFINIINCLANRIRTEP